MSRMEILSIVREEFDLSTAFICAQLHEFPLSLPR